MVQLVWEEYGDGDLVIKVPQSILKDPRFRLGVLVARGFGPEEAEFLLESGRWIPGETEDELRELARELQEHLSEK